jgi:hypothetical protein
MSQDHLAHCALGAQMYRLHCRYDEEDEQLLMQANADVLQVSSPSHGSNAACAVMGADCVGRSPVPSRGFLTACTLRAWAARSSTYCLLPYTLWQTTLTCCSHVT